MKEEIKEIELDHFNNINELKQNVESWIKEDDMYWERWFSLYDLKTLLDCITNLQDYKQRNEKAIEYINKLSNKPNVFGHYGIDGNCKRYLLNILKGDKDE